MVRKMKKSLVLSQVLNRQIENG